MHLNHEDVSALTNLRDALDKTIGGGEKNAPVRRFPFPGALNDRKGGSPRSGIKVHHGAHGEVYELAAGAKMADISSQKERPDVPLDRWLAATLLGDRCEDKAALQFASDQNKSLSGTVSGVLIPAGFQGEWIDNLRSFMVLEAAGMTTATMNSQTVTSSRVVSDPSVGWRSEGAALTAGDPTFELRQLMARTLGVRVQATAELAQDSPDFGSQLMNVMGKALAREIDLVGMLGTGLASQPTGILNTTGVQAINAVGIPSGYGKFVAGTQNLLEANVPLEVAQKNVIMSPRTWGTLEGLVDSTGQPMRRPQSLEDTAFRPTTSIPNTLGAGNDESLAFMGDFSDLVLGVRMEATIEALRLQTYASNLQVEFVGWTRVDFMVRRPASFVVLNGIKA
ncbi:phage major capsid protein [Novosphingobium sp.]|uniref:phage major capsid protein n=1 Tax=Novosphingobium sp. TaxID=1874826 RepID=UPI0027332E0A|nr:phage major capsid protein [Novosphingobium sp.]MDP3908716.1 phage major capsid protein [Novosphingobium sp.]